MPLNINIPSLMSKAGTNPGRSRECKSSHMPDTGARTAMFRQYKLSTKQASELIHSEAIRKTSRVPHQRGGKGKHPTWPHSLTVALTKSFDACAFLRRCRGGGFWQFRRPDISSTYRQKLFWRLRRPDIRQGPSGPAFRTRAAGALGTTGHTRSQYQNQVHQEAQ